MSKRIMALVLVLTMLILTCGHAEDGSMETEQPGAGEDVMHMEDIQTVQEEEDEPAVREDAPAEDPEDGATDPEPSEPAVSDSASPEVTESPTPEATVDPKKAEAWMEGEDGQPIWAALDELVAAMNGKGTFYILAEKPVFVRDVTEDTLKGLEFLPDPEKFEKGKFVCQVSFEVPEGCQAPEDCETYIFVWVEAVPEETQAAPTQKPTPQPELELRVEAENYVPGQWSNVPIAFTLSGIPEDPGHYAYAVVAYDERFIILSGNTYTATDEGEYELRFVILDGIGDVVAKSARYGMMLDLTPPHGISVEMEGDSYEKYNVSAQDALSGVAAYSGDGGETWVEPDAEGMAAFTGQSGDVIPAGAILVRDAAGNIAAYDADFMLPEKPVSGGGGGWGGGGGGGSGEPSVPHAPLGEEMDLNPYNALELELPEEPMSTLVMGGVELPLTLNLDYAQDMELDEEYQALFTAKLARWGAEEAVENAGDDELPMDTLIISVVDEPMIESEYAYMFAFNGVVYRMLQNSGIDYLVFETRDGCVAISTAGFTGGSEYTRMKSEGVSTRRMDYSLRMEGDCLEETPLGLIMELTVAGEDEGEESEIYPMSDDETQDVYYYDVYVGTMDMLKEPFGAQALADEEPTEGDF